VNTQLILILGAAVAAAYAFQLSRAAADPEPGGSAWGSTPPGTVKLRLPPLIRPGSSQNAGLK
jgi:hypothetical protein